MKRPLCGLVLAGGKSTRMGTDKASLVHPDGRTLAQRSTEFLLEAGCSGVFLSLRQDQELPAGVPDDSKVLRDLPGGSNGPISGILAAMKAISEADWLVVACDLPRLDADTLTHLIASRKEGELFLAYRSEFDGLPEPLCAFYAAESKAVIEAAEITCPRKVLIQSGCRLLDPVRSGALDNANTPEDWTASLKS